MLASSTSTNIKIDSFEMASSPRANKQNLSILKTEECYLACILLFATYISFLCQINAICAIDKKFSYRRGTARRAMLVNMCCCFADTKDVWGQNLRKQVTLP